MITFRFEKEETSIYANKYALSDKIAEHTREFLKSNKIVSIPIGIIGGGRENIGTNKLKQNPGRV